MSWLFEDPTYVLICGGIAVVGLLIAVYNTGRVLFLILAGTAVALAGLGVLIERAVVTDYERVEQALYDGAEAVASNDAAKVQAFFASNASTNTKQLLGYMRQFKFDTVRIVRYEITMLPKQNPRTAKVALTVWAQLSVPAGIARAGNVDLRFEREGDRWLLQDFELVTRE